MTQHDQLSVEKCDVFDQTQLQPHIDKTDVVLSCLGFPISRGSGPVPHYLEVARNVSECMHAAGKRRVIFMHSWYVWFLMHIDHCYNMAFLSLA